jgi:hypothetical protein
MKYIRLVTAAALTLLATSLVVPAVAGAQGYGNGDRESAVDRPADSPLMSARSWHEVERAGDTWDGLWTFDDNRHRTISAMWVDRATGQRVSAPRMLVRQRGQQIIISRPGTGDYVGTLSGDGRTLRGTMSWVQGSFTARIPQQ